MNVIPNYISLFDIAVMPHSNQYGSPMKVLEYMAMAKATIAPRLSPLQDVIKEQENGLLFEPLNRNELAEKITYLLVSDEERLRIGQNARSAVLKEFNWNVNATKIIKLYEGLKRTEV